MRTLLLWCMGAWMWSGLVIALPSEPVDPVITAMAWQQRWLRLLHYQSALGGRVSLIDYPGFFLAPTGKFDPVAELAATRKAIRTGWPRVGPEHLDPQCAFPARARFLQEELHEPLRSVTCEGMDYWRERLPLRAVSLGFSTAYASNPASLFGHTFLRLHLKKQARGQDYALAFAAVPDDSMAYIYMLKGLTGRYPGVFSLAPYFDYVTNYTHGEHRDLWLYELNLSDRQLTLLLEHLWELVQNSNIDYFFLDDNCSYALLSVLEVLDDQWNFTQNIGPITLPMQTVRVVAAEPGLVRHVAFQSSLRNQFNARRQMLTESEAGDLATLVTPGAAPREVGAPVLDAAITYHSLRRSKLKAEERPSLDPQLQKILLRRAQLGKASPAPPVIARNRPDLGHGTRSLGLGIGHSHGEPYGVVSGRYGFHHVLDPDTGFEPGLQIQVLDLQARVDDEQQLRLTHGTLVDIVSLSPFDPLDPLFSWRVKLGWSEQDAYLSEFAVGVTLAALDSHLLVFALPGIEVGKAPGNEPAHGALVAEVGIIGSWSDGIKSRIVGRPLVSQFPRHRKPSWTVELAQVFGSSAQQIHFEVTFARSAPTAWTVVSRYLF